MGFLKSHIQRLSGLCDIFDRQIWGQPAIQREQTTHRGAGHIFHHKVQQFVLLARIIDLHQIGMIEPGQNLRLAHKPRGSIGGSSPWEDFDGNLSPQAYLGGAIDCASGAFPNLFFQKIASQSVPHECGHTVLWRSSWLPVPLQWKDGANSSSSLKRMKDRFVTLSPV